MKILTSQQIREADQYTISYEPISSLALMERAANNASDAISAMIQTDKNRYASIKIFCGMGNNGGDGLVIARNLSNFFEFVNVYIVHHAQQFSSDFTAQYQIVEKFGTVDIQHIRNPSHFPTIAPNDLVIDSIFGSGLNKPLTDWVAQLIEHINNSQATILAIDIPSGLYAEDNDTSQQTIVRANKTFTFQLPKLSMLYDSNYDYVGDFQVLPIGLHFTFLDNALSKNFVITPDLIQKIRKKRKKNAHKGTFGHALLVGGSYGKMGAAMLMARACLRGGVGLLTIHVPQCGYAIMQTALPEAMVDTDMAHQYVTYIPQHQHYDALGIGCGIGKAPETVEALKNLLQRTTQPVVIDADALNIISEQQHLLKYLPPSSILTPHPKEFARLIGENLEGFARHQRQKQFSEQYDVYVVLKGAYTCITTPEGESYFNITGNPGMATAGSGDVLAGLLVALLAQGYTSQEAALLGVYLHGKAGNLAAITHSQEALIASDIIEHFGKAFSSTIQA